MGVPFSYSLRNLWARRLTTFLTASGMALVVFVFAAILMLAKGLEQTLVQTGSFDNVMVLRQGSTSEVMSSVTRLQASILETRPETAIDQDGQPFAARETIVLVNLPKRGGENLSNVLVRGIGEKSLALRPQVRIAEGRAPRPGSTEILAGGAISRGFKNAELGGVIRFGARDWTVVGILDAGATGFNSELWCDVEQLNQTFRRSVYSIAVAKLRASSEFQPIKSVIESDPRLSLEVKRESVFYSEQSEMMATFLRVLGLSITVIFSLGAMIGAMITMYSAVANRVGEIGTLRALGFQRRSILIAFLAEAALLGSIGGAAGLFFASFLQFFTFSTVNFQSFSELAFSFTLTPSIAAMAMAFALLMGVVGGFLPAVRAARLKIVDALRSG